MKRFTIGEGWDSYQLTGEQAQELQAAIGFDRIAGQRPPYEIVIEDSGKIFSRSLYANERDGVRPDNYFMSIGEDWVMCICECKIFEIRQYGYGVIGRCINCGNEFEWSF